MKINLETRKMIVLGQVADFSRLVASNNDLTLEELVTILREIAETFKPK